MPYNRSESKNWKVQTNILEQKCIKPFERESKVENKIHVIERIIHPSIENNLKWEKNLELQIMLEQYARREKAARDYWETQ